MDAITAARAYTRYGVDADDALNLVESGDINIEIKEAIDAAIATLQDGSKVPIARTRQVSALLHGLRRRIVTEGVPCG